MRAQRTPAPVTVPETDAPTLAVSVKIPVCTEQDAPSQVPRLMPTFGGWAFGLTVSATALRVTVTVPAAVTVNEYDAAPLAINVPVNVSVVKKVDDGVVVVVV